MSAPNQIDLVYRKVGTAHIFASSGISGLMHVGHTDLQIALETAIEALNHHVRAAYDIEAHYSYDGDVKDIVRKIEQSMIAAIAVHLDQTAHACN